MRAFAYSLVALTIGALVVTSGAHTRSEGPLKVERAIYSPAVEGRLRLAVYLPAGYASSEKRYPVVYFLHGLPAAATSFRGADFLARALAASGRRAIIVAPQGARDHDSDPEYLDWGPGRNWETCRFESRVRSLVSWQSDRRSRRARLPWSGPWQRNDRCLSTALRVAPLLLFVWMVRSELVVIALGGLFALLLDPLKRRLARRSPRLARRAPLLLTVGSIVLVVIPFVFIAARVVVSAQSFLAGGLEDIAARLQTFAAEHFAGLAQRLDHRWRASRAAPSLAQRVGGSIAGLASGVASSLPGQIVDLFLFVLSLFYFLRDGASLLRWLMRLSPFPEHETDELFASIRETVNGAIFGQLATSMVQGGLTLIALYLFRDPRRADVRDHRHAPGSNT